MGSEQSAQPKNSKGTTTNHKRAQSSDGAAGISSRRLFSSSSRHSVSSDSDVPYVSYVRTSSVNEDQRDRRLRWNEMKPRAREKNLSREKRDVKSRSLGSLVVVKSAPKLAFPEADVLLDRLTEIPPFVPIIRGSLNSNWTKDPEITEKIAQTPLTRIGLIYSEKVARLTNSIEKEQLILISRINDLDEKLRVVMKTYSNTQRNLGKYAEKLSHVIELSNGLTKCHDYLNQSLESIEILNNLLPMSERLEAFVWKTG